MTTRLVFFIRGYLSLWVSCFLFFFFPFFGSLDVGIWGMASQHNTCIGIDIGVGPFDLAGMGGFSRGGDRRNRYPLGSGILDDRKKKNQGSREMSRWGAGLYLIFPSRSGPISGGVVLLVGNILTNIYGLVECRSCLFLSFTLSYSLTLMKPLMSSVVSRIGVLDAFFLFSFLRR